MLFFGHVFSEKGMSPDPKKVEALENVAPPTAAFCSRFIKDFALITRTLRQLTCDGARWQWTQEEQLSFERLKAEKARPLWDTSTQRNLLPSSSMVALSV